MMRAVDVAGEARGENLGWLVGSGALQELPLACRRGPVAGRGPGCLVRVLVGVEGVEPSRLCRAPGLESGASASSATLPWHSARLPAARAGAGPGDLPRSADWLMEWGSHCIADRVFAVRAGGGWVGGFRAGMRNVPSTPRSFGRDTGRGGFVESGAGSA